MMPWGLEHTHVIDIILQKKDGPYTLVMVGPEAWFGSADEVFILRHKMDTYVEYIESGDFYEDCPARKGHSVRFEFDNVAPLPPSILKVLEQLKTRLREEHGIPLDLVDL